MAKLNYTVDTQPMAQEISGMSRHVNETTTAVIAMQTAVIYAEEKAANHVCENVNQGFFALIRSQISQKMANLQSEVDSHFMQLDHQKNALLSIKNRMQRDYNRIASRYIKLFNGLNSNLKHRVFELDKPTIDFAVKEVDKVSNRTKYLISTVPISQLESLVSSQNIITSNLKFSGLSSIHSIQSFLLDMEAQKKLTDRILINDSGLSESSSVYLPLLISETNTNQNGIALQISAPEVEMDYSVQSAIKSTVISEYQKLDWKSAAPPSQELKSEFNKLVSSSSKPDRIKELTNRLFQSLDFQTI